MSPPPIIDIIGYYGPVILFAITFHSLIGRTPYLIVFTFGSIVNIFINNVLKSTFREPRPNNQRFFIHNEKAVEEYGFPSGHAQTSFFAVAYLFFVGGYQPILLFMTLLCGITLYQRWKYRRHDIKQLVFGSVFGILFAYGVAYTTQYYLHHNTHLYI